MEFANNPKGGDASRTTVEPLPLAARVEADRFCLGIGRYIVVYIYNQRAAQDHTRWIWRLAAANRLRCQ